MTQTQTRGVVLGGGGVTGIAWEIGVIAGLERCGVDLRNADLFVGTSAGAAVGAYLAYGDDVQALAAQQADPAQQVHEQYRPYSQADADARNRQLMEKVGGDLAAARRRIGAYAMRSTTPSQATRLDIIAARLGRTRWPSRPLRLTAVDVASGELRVFDAASEVRFLDAVAASCAVPGSWPAVAIEGRHYMDGGVHSITNAQVAQGMDRVIVLAPFGYSEQNPVAGHLREEVANLRIQGARVQVIEPDAAALAAIGDNVLDPSRKPAALDAGVTMGERLAAELSWW
ncbi:patatin-like phospholipase family protein [Achromobacter sp. GG226]|uniref:patatin-like phospholipase family protein n=1 Tax=Verticiella alkaliphila TaxID=2779529 RepID=UPI001C0C376D|nr:patatin-like phospholipase family protein [Verticiella sp. GG226]MBU4609738.1 patatin-like phospholipase family protein [Verticiella sp. GG226]